MAANATRRELRKVISKLNKRLKSLRNSGLQTPALTAMEHFLNISRQGKTFKMPSRGADKNSLDLLLKKYTAMSNLESGTIRGALKSRGINARKLTPEIVKRYNDEGDIWEILRGDIEDNYFNYEIIKDTVETVSAEKITPDFIRDSVEKLRQLDGGQFISSDLKQFIDGYIRGEYNSVEEYIENMTE